MYEGKRPGGLTALAVFNFIGVGVDTFLILGVLSMIAFGGTLAGMAERSMREQAAARARDEGRDPARAELTPKEQAALAHLRSYEGSNRIPALLQLAGLVASAGLLLAAGVGYLRQRRWGRILGNIYVIVSVASTIYETRMVPPEYGGGLQFAALRYFVYPVITLCLVNGTFREDLKR